MIGTPHNTDAAINLLLLGGEVTPILAGEVTMTPVDNNNYMPDISPDSIFNNVRWETCYYNDNGEPIGYNGKLWKEYKSLQLRTICS
jgi:hypothetical protein